MRIGHTLKAMRESRGLSQRAVARMLGVSNGYVSLLEADKRSPSLAFLDAFAHLMGTSVSALVLVAESPSTTLYVVTEVGETLYEGPDRRAAFAACGEASWRGIVSRIVTNREDLPDYAKARGR